jgi:hypothetical protein
MIRRILAYILFGLGFLIMTFFKKYTGDILPYPFLFYILGLLMFIGGGLFLRFTPTHKEVKTREKLDKLISDLLEHGEKVKVNLTDCEIKENNYTEERNRYGNENELLTLDIERDIQALNAITGDSMRNIEFVNVVQTVIIFYFDKLVTGRKEKFISRVIPKDKITLMIYLDKQKDTFLYIDKVDREKYYFDLDFLNKT